MTKKDNKLTHKEIALLMSILHERIKAHAGQDNSAIEDIQRKLVAQDYELITSGM